MKSPHRIRPAVTTDIPRIVELWREMWDLHEGLDPDRYVSTPAAEQVISLWIEQNLRGERAQVFVAEQDGTIVGYLLALILENPPVVPQQFFGYVSEVAVTATARDGGVGQILLNAAHDWFRSKGLSIVEVNISALNPDALRFWKRAGYSDYLHRLRRNL